MILGILMALVDDEVMIRGVPVEVGPMALAYGLIMIGSALLLSLLAYLKVRFTIYRITTERIESQKGWLRRRFDNMDLFRVKDVSYREGIIDRLVGIGNILVVS